MSAITTLLTTAAITIGAVALAKRLKGKFDEVEARVREEARKAAGDDPDVLDFEKNPETGAYEARDIRSDAG